MEKGEKLIESLELRSKNEYIPKFIFGIYNISKGNLDLAFELFEQALDEHDSFIPWGIVNPIDISNIQEDPRYMELLKKAGFVE